MVGIEGQSVVIQTTPRTIEEAIQGRSGTAIRADILLDPRGFPYLAVSVLIGAPGVSQIIRTVAEDEFYVQAPPVATTGTPAPTNPPPVGTATTNPNVTISLAPATP